MRRPIYTDPKRLLADLGTEAETLSKPPFPFRVPASFAGRIEPGNPEDPLLLQVLPRPEELERRPGFSDDPLGERSFQPLPGLIHKYHGRVLLITTPACSIYCRYCFRRAFPYGEATLSGKRLEAAIAYLRGRREVEEVILSGGDPFMLSNRRLEELFLALAELPHLERIRIHTRVPVAEPERISRELLQLLASSPRPTVVVIHCNHPRELTGEVALALAGLRESGASLFNQAVLLRGINDTPEQQIDLWKRLFELGVLPYYLHLLDRVTGSASFEVPEPDAKRIYRRMRERLPGYLLPRLVREIAGVPYKWPLL